MAARSYLFVPGYRPEMLSKALNRGADALICDLEDAVATRDKDAARATMTAWLDGLDDPPCIVYVRVNADSLEHDLTAAARRPVRGVVVPKASAELLLRIDRMLTRIEHDTTGASFDIIALVETAGALHELPAITAAPRVSRLAIGEADLTAELGMSPTYAEPELLPVRVNVVVASAAAGLPGPIGPVATDFRDLESLRATTRQLSQLGFRARAAIHPAQVAVINDALTPTPDELDRARRVVERFDAAGQGAATDDSGHMIDLAVVRRARQTLEQGTGR